MQKKSFPKQDLLILLVLGLGFQAIWALLLTYPTYMDAFYYATNGARLANGYGFTEQIIWQYLDQPTGLPTPSHSYWMPLTSIITAVAYQISDNFRAAQLPFWFLAGAFSLLGYTIARFLGGERWQAWIAGLLTMSGGFYTGYLNQPSTFAPFAWFGCGCLLVLAWSSTRMEALKRPFVVYTAVGALAGAAHLTRADGVLLLVVALLVVIVQERGRSILAAAAGILVGYLLVMGGWFVHSWMTWGRILPTAGTQTIFLTRYDDLFAYGRSFDWHSFQAWGWSNIINSRLTAVWLSIQNFLAVNTLIFLAPFAIWGGVYKGRHAFPKLLPMLLYLVGLYGAMSLLFAFPGARGGLFHSSITLWPWLMALVPFGVSRAVATVARYLPHWQPARAERLFSLLFVGLALLLTAGVTVSNLPTAEEQKAYQQFRGLLPETAVVMVGNAPSFYYHTNISAVSIPNEPIDVVIEAAEQFGASHLVLDANVPIPLESIYFGAEQSAFELVASQGEYQLYAFKHATE